MKLRDIEKLKNEAKFYKNIDTTMNIKKSKQPSQEILNVILKLGERKKLLEALDKGTIKEEEIELLDSNNEYFEKLSEEDRVNIEKQFAEADDIYAATEQWQSLYMAFISTSNLSVYKAVDEFNATLEDLQERRADINNAKRDLKKTINGLQNKYKNFSPKTANEDYLKYKKEKEGLESQLEQIPKDYKKKWQEEGRKIPLMKEKHKEEMKALASQKEKLHSEYEKQKNALNLRKQQLEEVYRRKKFVDSMEALTSEGREVYKWASERLESQKYFENLNTKEYTARKEKYLQIKKEQEEARDKVAKNAAGPLKRYLEEKPTPEEAAKLELIRKARSFFLVCKEPYGEAAKKFKKKYPEYEIPHVPDKRTVESILKSPTSRTNDVTTEKEKKQVAFAEAFRAVIREVAPIFLEDVKNPTEKEINEVVAELEKGFAKDGMEKLRKQRKAIEKVVDDRKAAIWSEFSEKDKEDYAVYTAPEKTDEILVKLEKSRENYNKKVDYEIDMTFYNNREKEVRLTREQAEINIQKKCDNNIEGIIKEEIKESTREFYKKAGIKLESLEYFSELNTKEYTALKETYLQTKEEQKKEKDKVAKEATGALKRYLEHKPTPKEADDIAILKKAIGFISICTEPKSKEAEEHLKNYPEFGVPKSGKGNLGDFLDSILPESNRKMTEEEKKMVAFVESFKAVIKEIAPVLLRDVENPTDEDINEKVEELENRHSMRIWKGRLERQINKIEKDVIDRKAAILSEFNEKDKEDYAVYTAPEKTDKILEQLEKSRENYNRKVNNEIQRVRRDENKDITRQEAESRIQKACDQCIEILMDEEINGESKGKYNLKKYQISSSERNVRYDILIENIADYEKNIDVYKNVEQEIAKVNLEIEENEKQMIEIKKIEKAINEKPQQHEKAIEEIKGNMDKLMLEKHEKIKATKIEIGKKSWKMSTAILFQDPAGKFQLDQLKKVLDEKCPDAPKLDLNSVISKSQSTAVALLRQKDVYAKGHTNSKEFDNMIAALDIVANWGKENPALKGMKNPPKSYEEALDRLKASRKVYREAKDGQKRPFPSKRRRMRLQFADIIDVFVDKEKENLKDVIADEKVVESWNQYFESRAETPILKEQNKAPVKDAKQIEEPVFTEKELEFVIR